jgi:hypothetical protein
LYDGIVDALARGATYEAAGALIGRSARSVRRRMADEEFARKVRLRRREMVARSVGRLNAALDLAVDAVLGTLESSDEDVVLRAARLVFDKGSLLTDRLDVDDLVDKLQQRLAEPPGEDG